MEVVASMSPIILATVILCTVPVILYFLSQKLWPKKDAGGSPGSTPPGSTGWPWIGETMEYINTAKVGIPQKFIDDRRKKYSSRIFKTSLLGQPMVMFTNADGNKFVFSNENKLVTSWWPSSVDKFFDTGNVSKSEAANNMRKFVTPVLKPDALRKYVGVVDSMAKDHLKSHWQGQDIVHVHPLAKDLTFTLACRLLLGISDPEYIDKLSKPFVHFSAGLFSLPIDLPWTNFRSAIRSARELRKVFEAMVRKWKVDALEDKVSGTSGMLSRHLMEIIGEGEIVSDSDVATRILALISASYDNVSTAMTFVIKYLAELPEVYDQVLKEHKEIAAAKVSGDLLNWDDIQKMRYTWNVASEVLRLHPPSSGAFREAMIDFTYDGFLVPKGWKIHWNTFATHKNAEYFPDPEKFDPSRFEKNTIVPYSYVPFGGGPHMCPGKEYARIAILALTHNVVTNFKFEKVFPNEGIIGLPVLRPAKGLPIRLSPH